MFFFVVVHRTGVFLDIATLGELARLTGTGAVFKYFNDFSDAFLTDLKYSLNSSFAFDCILKGILRFNLGCVIRLTLFGFSLSCQCELPLESVLMILLATFT